MIYVYNNFFCYQRSKNKDGFYLTSVSLWVLWAVNKKPLSVDVTGSTFGKWSRKKPSLFYDLWLSSKIEELLYLWLRTRVMTAYVGQPSWTGTLWGPFWQYYSYSILKPSLDSLNSKRLLSAIFPRSRRFFCSDFSAK